MSVPTDSDIQAAWPHTGEVDTITVMIGGNEASYMVGELGVTRIEKTVKAGEHAFIPYVRVWQGESVSAEYCQHKLTACWFKVRQ